MPKRTPDGGAPDTGSDYADPDNLNMEGGERTDGIDKDEKRLIRAVRSLRELIDHITPNGGMIVDVTADTTTCEPIAGTWSWVEIKKQFRDQLAFLQEQRAALMGEMNTRESTTTGSFETETQETKQQVHIGTLPVGEPDEMGNHETVPCIVRWEYHPNRPERNDNGSVVCFPQWEEEPDPDNGKRGVRHPRAGEPVTMWRIAELWEIEEGHEVSLVEAFDDVATAQAQLRAGRRRDIKVMANEAPEKFKGDFGKMLGR